MPKSRNRKEHKRKLKHRNLMNNHQVLAIQALRKKIYEEAKERYEREQNGISLKTND